MGFIEHFKYFQRKHTELKDNYRAEYTRINHNISL